MRHKKKNKILGRVRSDREKMIKQLCSNMLEFGYVSTTETKAKLLKRQMDKFVALAGKVSDLHGRRMLLRKLMQKNDLDRLMEVAGKRKILGSVTRVTRTGLTRNDGAHVFKVEFIEK